MRLTLRLVTAPEGTDSSALYLGFDKRGGSIGRSPTNTHVVIDTSNRISSQHAEIAEVGGQFFLTDLSRNGVYFNEDPTPVGRGNRRPIANGDRIELGPLLYAAEVSGIPDETGPKGGAPRRDPLDGLLAPPVSQGPGSGGLMGAPLSPQAAKDPLLGLMPPAPPPGDIAQIQRKQPTGGDVGSLDGRSENGTMSVGAAPDGQDEAWLRLLPGAGVTKSDRDSSKGPTSAGTKTGDADSLDDFLAGIVPERASPSHPVAAAVAEPWPALPQAEAPLPFPSHAAPVIAATPTISPRLDAGRAGTISDADSEFGLNVLAGVTDLPLPDLGAGHAGLGRRLQDATPDVPTRGLRPPNMLPTAMLAPVVDPNIDVPTRVLDPLSSGRPDVAELPVRLSDAPALDQSREPLPPELMKHVIILGRDIGPVATNSASDPVELMRRRAQLRMKDLRDGQDVKHAAGPSAEQAEQSDWDDLKLVSTSAVLPRSPIAARSSQSMASDPAGAPAVSQDERALLNAFWTAVGIDPAAIDQRHEAEILTEVGRFVRVSAQGMVQILALRRSVKDEIRFEQTMLTQQDNNPFKVYFTGDEVLSEAIVHRRGGFASLPLAAQQGLDNLRDHQLMTTVALQAAISVVMARFNPATIEAATKKRGLIFRRTDYRRLWLRFAGFFRDYDKDIDRNVRSVMEEAFQVAQRRIGSGKS